ncbi:hypothetical protein B9Z55_027055 [Caenorhabditis nigoni]|uniref:Uncharacterized protein n=1 Tax=Caenorhabditis nigoni TaxID=1611254 RepID=A0A2G5SIG0_9PELO|nr:hypothetical protein B9Z55_027055 [Caenorhabditis nigoni]
MRQGTENVSKHKNYVKAREMCQGNKNFVKAREMRQGTENVSKHKNYVKAREMRQGTKNASGNEKCDKLYVIKIELPITFYPRETNFQLAISKCREIWCLVCKHRVHADQTPKFTTVRASELKIGC